MICFLPFLLHATEGPAAVFGNQCSLSVGIPQIAPIPYDRVILSGPAPGVENGTGEFTFPYDTITTLDNDLLYVAAGQGGTEQSRGSAAVGISKNNRFPSGLRAGNRKLSNSMPCIRMFFKWINTGLKPLLFVAR
jgi:hypothetical protein